MRHTHVCDVMVYSYIQCTDLHITPCVTGAVDALKRVLVRGRDARGRVGLDAGLGSRKEVCALLHSPPS